MILVTGGTGFVGPKVVHVLRAEDREVRALVRDPGSRPAKQLEAWGCELARGDMTDAESLNRAVAGCDAVVHLVAIPTGSAETFERVMIRGTRDLLAAAKRAGVTRFVLMSALGTHERSRELTPYFRAKWDEERAVVESGIEHVVFRPSFIFGRDGGMLPFVVRQVRWSPVLPVVGGPRRMQPIWIDDVAAFFVKALSLGQATNRTFEIAGPDVVTWDELYDRIMRALGKRRLTFHMPMRVARAGAAVIEKVPTGLPISRDGLAQLEFEDNVADPAAAIETFGISPIPLDEQIRRALE